MRAHHAIALFPLLFACNAASLAPTSSGASAASGAVPETLLELLHEHRDATGRNITFDEDTRDLLASIPVRRIGPAEIDTILVGPVPVWNAAAGFEMVPLEYAHAGEVARHLSYLLAASRGGDPAVAVTSDNRTNSLLLHGAGDRIDRLKDLIGKLDIEAN